jgi:hypothetical protein
MGSGLESVRTFAGFGEFGEFVYVRINRVDV